MPYFAWKGVNLEAQRCKGAQYAADPAELDELLYKKDIALLECRPKKVWWRPAISLQNKIDYFMQLHMLLNSGMRLPQGLRLVAGQLAHVPFMITAHSVADQVTSGISLWQALALSAKTFDPLMIQMTYVGQESGNLIPTIQVLVGHLESLAQFKARLRAAIILPLITFVFFMMVIGIMLIVIVPQFASIFASMKKELPAATATMIRLSQFLRSWYMPLIVMGTLALAKIIMLILTTKKAKKNVDAFLLRVPILKSLIITKTMAGFCQSVSILLQGGIPLVTAITIAKESIGNISIKNRIYQLEKEVNAGITFAQAMEHMPHLCGQETVSLVYVGQESGKLADMLARVADMYQQRLLRMLSRINVLFQPCLLIILGLMITGLILALYTPIMSLSYAV